MNTKSTSIDGRIIASQNERKVLHALHRFGWLRTADLDTLIWPDASQGIQMARRTLKRLTERGEILSHRQPDGTPIHTLSARGADRIRDAYPDARSGKDQMRDLKQFQHRNLCNMYAIHCINKGRNVYTEREIVTNRAPFRNVMNKQPDMIHADSNWDYLSWCEVEHSWKKSSDYTKLINFMAHNLSLFSKLQLSAAHDLYMHSITIVTSEVKHIVRLVKTLIRMEEQDYLGQVKWEHIRYLTYVAFINDEGWREHQLQEWHDHILSHFSN